MILKKMKEKEKRKGNITPSILHIFYCAWAVESSSKITLSKLQVHVGTIFNVVTTRLYNSSFKTKLSRRY